MATEQTVDRVRDYYANSPGYVENLDGNCHFGYTPEGEDFDFLTAQLEMTRFLGGKLDLPEGSIVLDAGCGFGSVSVPLVDEFGLQAVGLDLIMERLRSASNRSEESQTTDGAFFASGSYCNLPLKDNSFDGVFTMETLVHADPLESALAEFKRVLKPGGRLVLHEYTIPAVESFDPVVSRPIVEEMIERTGMASIHKFTHGGFPDILEKAGFTNIEVEDISKNVWPTWRWLFNKAVKKIVPSIVSGDVFENTNLLASLMIWPTRKIQRYNAITANKPLS